MRRMAASPAAPIPAHRPAHFRRHDCRRHCRRTRRPAWHGASHRCPRSCRPGRPLNRRAAPLRRVPRRRFPDLPNSTNSASDGPAPVSVATPDASMMHRARARAEPILASSSEDVRRLPASLSCRIERVSVRYTRFLMGLACLCRSVSSTDTRTDTRGPGTSIRTDTRAARRRSRGWRPLSATDTRATYAGSRGGRARMRSGRAPISLNRRRPGAASPGRSGPRRTAFQARPRALRGPSRRAVRSPGTKCSATPARSAAPAKAQPGPVRRSPTLARTPGCARGRAVGGRLFVARVARLTSSHSDSGKRMPLVLRTSPAFSPHSRRRRRRHGRRRSSCGPSTASHRRLPTAPHGAPDTREAEARRPGPGFRADGKRTPGISAIGAPP